MHWRLFYSEVIAAKSFIISNLLNDNTKMIRNYKAKNCHISARLHFGGPQCNRFKFKSNRLVLMLIWEIYAKRIPISLCCLPEILQNNCFNFPQKNQKSENKKQKENENGKFYTKPKKAHLIICNRFYGNQISSGSDLAAQNSDSSDSISDLNRDTSIYRKTTILGN